MSREPLTLIADESLSNDLTDCLRHLLKEARAGRLIGLAFVGIVGTDGYIADTAGEAHRSPTWTRGALRALDDKLAQRIHAQQKRRPTGTS
jgi:hypothetical protein